MKGFFISSTPHPSFFLGGGGVWLFYFFFRNFLVWKLLAFVICYVQHNWLSSALPHLDISCTNCPLTRFQKHWMHALGEIWFNWLQPKHVDKLIFLKFHWGFWLAFSSLIFLMKRLIFNGKIDRWAFL